MLDGLEDTNELIWDESDTRLLGLTADNSYPKKSFEISCSSKKSYNTSTCSLEKSLSICFSDISTISDVHGEKNSDTNSESSQSLISYDTTNNNPVKNSCLREININDEEKSSTDPVLNLDFDFNVRSSFNGVSRTTPYNLINGNYNESPVSSSFSLYSYNGDERKSKSHGNLKDLGREARTNTITSSNQQFAKWRDDTINCTTPRKTGYRVTFEIISARTVTTGSSSGVKNKHISYTIIIERSPGLESQPGVIERRYTEFSSLYMGLMKRFPLLLKDFSFPKKTLVGNFTTQVIRERSIAFQSLLTYCLSVDELRTSRPFIDFLHSKEMIEARRYLRRRNFEEAANILENCYFIQEKIALQGVYDQSNAQVYQILILLVASMIASGSPQEALNYALKAVPMALESDFYDRNELTVPFLWLTQQLFGSSGKPTDAFDRKFIQMREKGIKVNERMTCNLMEMIVKKDYTNLTCLRFF